MDSKEMLDILELAVAARSPLAPLDANKASRALLGLLDPRETEEAYETAASTHEGAEVFSEAADHLASLEKLSDAEVRAAILDGGTRSIVAQALSEVREAKRNVQSYSLVGLVKAIKDSVVTKQQARAILRLNQPLSPAAVRSGQASVRGRIVQGRLVLREDVEGPATLILSNNGLEVCTIQGSETTTIALIEANELFDEGQELSLTVLHSLL